MSADPIKVLQIEDNPGDARLLQKLLSEASGARFDLVCAERLSAGLDCLRASGFDVVLLDLSLPDSQGFDTFAQVHACEKELPIIVLSGLDDEALAERAVREGPPWRQRIRPRLR